jgi:hypothetical protein
MSREPAVRRLPETGSAPGVGPRPSAISRRHTHRIDAAFLLLVPTPGEQLAEHRRALVTNPDPRGLHFSPQDHCFWADTNGALALGIQGS